MLLVHFFPLLFETFSFLYRLFYILTCFILINHSSSYISSFSFSSTFFREFFFVFLFHVFFFSVPIYSYFSLNILSLFIKFRFLKSLYLCLFLYIFGSNISCNIHNCHILFCRAPVNSESLHRIRRFPT